MALLLPTLGELSGSIRGNVFSHNKGGAYVRGRTIPTNPSSTKQTAARSALATLSSRWSTLTGTQRDEWNMWATLNPVVNRLGQPFQRTGQQAFVGLNCRLIQAGDDSVDECPSTTGPSDLVTVGANANVTSHIIVTFAPTPLPDGARLVLWQTLPASIGRNPNRNQARLVGYSDVADTSPIDFFSPYPGLIDQITNLWFQVMDASGQLSAGLKFGPLSYDTP